VEAAARAVNDRWATVQWSPVVLHTDDNFARSVAALVRYDALLVNPVRDGMNLVAKEGAALNQRDGVVVLSRQAGAWDELSEASIGVNPFDVKATADALELALTMGSEERRRLSTAARSASTARSLHTWLDDQLAAVGESL
ncbi:MAG: trehalose-6-phosphate synthase, partial [Acidimicrobiales bacterium]